MPVLDGVNEFIRGYFTASTGVDATEQAEQIEQFVDEVASWANGVGEVTAAERSLFIGRALAILDGVQRFQAELAAPSPCPPDPTFGTELTPAAQDVLARLVAAIPRITNPAVVSLALGSGAIGAGSPVPDGAAALRAQLEADVNAKWNDQLANYPGSTTDADLVDTARTAQMLGMEQLGAIAPSDVILVTRHQRCSGERRGQPSSQRTPTHDLSPVTPAPRLGACRGGGELHRGGVHRRR